MGAARVMRSWRKPRSFRLFEDEPRAAELGRQLRGKSGEFLGKRRAIVALSLVAVGAMGLISLYQMGILRHLPEPPLPGLDADAVDASPEAYKLLETPDAVLGLGNYAVTMGLAAMGGKHRVREHPWMPLALAAKIGFDMGQAVRLTVVQWTRFRAFCFWCLVAAGTTLAAAPLVLGEARQAWRELRRQRGQTAHAE